MVQKITKVIEKLKAKIRNEKENKEKYVKTASGFTRERKLPLEAVVIFLTFMVKKTLSVELDKYFEIKGTNSCNKSAMSQRRKLLDYKIFIDLNDSLCDNVYKTIKCNRWNGRKVIAVDGTKVNTINKKEVVMEFGVQKTLGKDVPMAQVISSYDVLAKMCIKSEITMLNRSEGSVAMKMVESYSRDMIVLYDRGFPSSGLMHHHIVNNIPFVMRVKKDFNREVVKFVKKKSKEAIVEIKLSMIGKKSLKEIGYKIEDDMKIRVRLIRVELGEDFTILVTSLKNRKYYNRKKFKELYNMRWGIETYFDKMKNKMKVETFSGRTVENIKQEFHALVLASNIHSLIVQATEHEMHQSNNKREHKYDLKINQNVTLGIFKNRVVELLTSDDIKSVILLMIESFLRYKIPIISERKNVRKKRQYVIRGKHKTVLNYGEAI